MDAGPLPPRTARPPLSHCPPRSGAEAGARARHHWGTGGVLTLLGLLSLAPYLAALPLGDLREQTVEFECLFFAAFALYLVAVGLVLRERSEAGQGTLAIVVGFAVLFRVILVFTPPRLSDDMYRYVWDGRVQVSGYSPYAYPPSASALSPLRDASIWPQINRKTAVTVYPAGAELVYAGLWRLWPDSVRWFQVVMAAGGLLAGLLLIPLLRAFGRSPALALVYLWHPLVGFETAHSAHVDGLVLPLLVGAWLARVRGRDGVTGLLLGAATAIKLFPALLLPALWRPRTEAGRWRPGWAMPLAFALALALPYLPYLTRDAGVLGYLPRYFGETFNVGLAGLIGAGAWVIGLPPDRVMNGLLLAALLAIAVAFALRPARNGAEAVRRCIWPIGAFTLLTQNLQPWYVLWIVPLAALHLRPGRFGLRFDAWTGWLLLTRLIAVSYTFFIGWRWELWTALVQLAPLYLCLVAPPAWRWLRETRQRRRRGGAVAAGCALTGDPVKDRRDGAAASLGGYPLAGGAPRLPWSPASPPQAARGETPAARPTYLTRSDHLPGAPGAAQGLASDDEAPGVGADGEAPAGRPRPPAGAPSRLRARSAAAGGGSVKRALLVIAKRPEAGRTKTRLCPPLTPEAAAALYEAFLRDTLDVARAVAGVARIVNFTPERDRGWFERLAPDFALLPQRGADLGERLDHALSHCLRNGCERAVIMDSDSPTLPAAHVAEAFDLLDEADVVLGPCDDGGYYLIGLKRPRPRLLREVRMSTSHVLRDTLALAGAEGLRAALLPPWYDVDTLAELRRLAGELRGAAEGTAEHTRRWLQSSEATA